jgi:hypothetical protein
MLWPTTIQIDSHWNRAENRPASSTPRKSANILAWPSERTNSQASTARLAQPAQTAVGVEARSRLGDAAARQPRDGVRDKGPMEGAMRAR